LITIVPVRCALAVYHPLLSQTQLKKTLNAMAVRHQLYRHFDALQLPFLLLIPVNGTRDSHTREEIKGNKNGKIDENDDFKRGIMTSL
jgi:hypothetical protein